jgi:hypothetical protein
MSWGAQDNTNNNNGAHSGVDRWDHGSDHHRKPTSIGGTDEAWNKIRLPINLHRAWHTIAKNWSPRRIAQEINERYLDSEWKFIAVKRKKH